MTYKEIKARLSKCELTLEKLKNGKITNLEPADLKKKTAQLEVLRESYIKQLKEAQEKTYLVTPKSGKTAALSLGDDEVDALKDADDIEKIKSSDGQEVKEQEGLRFNVEETKAIAKKVGKSVALALKSLGDDVTSMKAKNIEEASFEIYVQYKNGSDDSFSFYIKGDTLHLQDFSFDKPLVEVGVKPSGEAIVNVDVLSNELQKHFKSLSEKVDAKDTPQLKKLSKALKGSSQAHLDQKKKLDKLINTEGKGDDHHYIKVPKAQYKKAMSILDNNTEPSFVKMDVVDDDGAGNVVIYFQFNEFSDDFNVDEREAFMYDAVQDLQAQDIDIADHSAELDEASDYMQENEAEDQGGDLDVGHQDDEPDMLKQYAYDIATYASKLYKALDKYDKMDGEVDFPNWWQAKVIMARDYISKAQHYLEFEEKQPAIDQLALENASAGEEDKFHKDLDKLVHKTFGHSSDEKKKTVKEDWGGSDQRAMNQQIHKALGEPTKMPSPFDDKLEYAVQDAVDFHWDDWPEYQTDREGLYTQAKRAYLRSMFKDTFDKMVRMFEPVDEVNEDRFLAASMDDLEQVIRNIAHTGEMSEDEAIELAIRKLEAMLDGRDDLDENINEGTELYNRNDIQIKRFSGGQRGLMVQITIGDKYIVVPAEEYPFLVRAMQSVQGDLKDMSRQYPRSKNMGEGFGKTKKAYDLVVAKMKELAKVYKAGDKSVIDQLKDLTAKKKKLEAMLDVEAGGIGAGQQLDPNINEYRGSGDEIKAIIRDKSADSGFSEQEEAMEVMEFIGQEYEIDFEFGAGPSRQAEQTLNEESTCCGRCGRKHVKGTKCKTPYLKGKDHCRTR